MKLTFEPTQYIVTVNFHTGRIDTSTFATWTTCVKATSRLSAIVTALNDFPEGRLIDAVLVHPCGK